MNVKGIHLTSFFLERDNTGSRYILFVYGGCVMFMIYCLVVPVATLGAGLASDS